MKRKKVIWFDISHPAQFNFYLESIKLMSERYRVYVSVLDRGKLNKIATKELDQTPVTLIAIGKHKGTKLSTIVDANVVRLVKLTQFARKIKPDVSVGNGFLHGFVGGLIGFPRIMFNDDMERMVNVNLMIKTSTEIYHITGSQPSDFQSKVKIFKSLKEWAYLSPKYFQPDKGILNDLGLEENKYIFIREVITGTLNYSFQERNIMAQYSSQIAKGYKVVLSLEDKEAKHLYPKDWVILEEPVNDIHSIIYYSRMVISSGDSMAREGAVLGVPSIYCGTRTMKANEVMINKGILFFVRADRLITTVEDLLGTDFKATDKDRLRNELDDEWIDVSQFICDRINFYLN